MIRVLAFALHASEALNFGKGLSDIDEPDLWEKDLTGAIDLWIEVGQPDDKRILKACGRAARVIVYSYSSTSHIWWGQIGNRVERAKNLSVIHIDADTSQALEKWRSARCNCNARFRMARSGSATMTRWCRSIRKPSSRDQVTATAPACGKLAVLLSAFLSGAAGAALRHC